MSEDGRLAKLNLSFDTYEALIKFINDYQVQKVLSSQKSEQKNSKSLINLQMSCCSINYAWKFTRHWWTTR